MKTRSRDRGRGAPTGRSGIGGAALALCTLGTCAAHGQDFAYGAASLKAGTLYVASSWKGTPDSGYDDVSNYGTESHTETIYSQALSSLPLSVAPINMYNFNGDGYSIRNDLTINWGGTVEGPRHFTLEGTLDQVFTLSRTVDWTLLLSEDEEHAKYSYYQLEDLTHGGPAIDLLSLDSGKLKAGTYELKMHAAAEWDYDGLSFYYGSGMALTFWEKVPSPGTTGLLALAALSGARRRR